MRDWTVIRPVFLSNDFFIGGIGIVNKKLVSQIQNLEIEWIIFRIHESSLVKMGERMLSRSCITLSLLFYRPVRTVTGLIL